MREFFKALFAESSTVSAMRVFGMMLVSGGVGIAYIGMFMNKPLSDITVLASALIGFGIGGKVVQKVSEVKKD